MRVGELFTNPATGKLSHSKLWANVSCAAATGMFVYQGVAGTLTADVWLIYLGVVGGYSAARRWIATQRSSKGGDANV